MANRRRPTPARYLAPLALALCAVAIFVVVSGSAGDGDKSDGKAATTKRGGAKRTTTTGTTPSSQPATYTVKTGDTLGAIAQQTGVPIERLQELNPQLDPQALVSGQMIKLRE